MKMTVESRIETGSHIGINPVTGKARPYSIGDLSCGLAKSMLETGDIIDAMTGTRLEHRSTCRIDHAIIGNCTCGLDDQLAHRAPTVGSPKVAIVSDGRGGFVRASHEQARDIGEQADKWRRQVEEWGVVRKKTYDAIESGKAIDIVATMSDAECRAMLLAVLADISRLTSGIKKRFPLIMGSGDGAIDTALTLVERAAQLEDEMLSVHGG